MIKGRRLPDTSISELPDGDIQPGDYWKCPNFDLGDKYPTNLTRTVWQVCVPEGLGIATLMSHTVRENEDGTITVAPGDGSSNSILVEKGAQGKTWHGYIDHGVWQEI